MPTLSKLQQPISYPDQNNISIVNELQNQLKTE